MNLEPWFIFIDGYKASSQSRMMEMPRLAGGSGFSTSTPAALASALALFPSGQKVLLNNAFERWLDDTADPLVFVSNHPDDAYSGKWGLWIENGVEVVRQKWIDWFTEFTNSTNNGVVDHLYSSLEGWGLWKDGQYSGGALPLWQGAYWQDQMANPKW